MKKKSKLSEKHKNKPDRRKVLVALSGGVDSAMAAQLLKNKGYEVAGVFLNFWKDDSALKTAGAHSGGASSLADARAVAARLGIPFYNFDFTGLFKEKVVDNFLGEYAAGRTPNPCVVCNRQVKLGQLLRQARRLGFDYVATGHYVKLKLVGADYRLFKAKDRKKDQSYFLYTLGQSELERLLFPLGNYTKLQVRQLAEKFGLPVAGKPESQDICFLSGDHNDFLKKHLALRPGDIRLLSSGEKIGEHQGLPLYTIGQRRGLVGGTGPYYAAKFDYRKNILYVVKDWNEARLYQRQLMAKRVNWLSGQAPQRAIRRQAAIRYGHPAVPCSVTPRGRSGCLVKFAQPQRAITPGQSVVFYRGEQVLGGGIIK
ncbi:MAG: tRNA 2-thiouridine(34) synthase MnmA [Patescibacteria group bacterium]